MEIVEEKKRKEDVPGQNLLKEEGILVVIPMSRTVIVEKKKREAVAPDQGLLKRKKSTQSRPGETEVVIGLKTDPDLRIGKNRVLKENDANRHHQ